MNRTHLSLVRAIIRHRHLPKALWAKALCTACYVINHESRRALPSEFTPYHICRGHTPTLAYYWVSRWKAWYLTMSPHAKKVKNRSRVAVISGYSGRSKVYQLLDAVKRKIVIPKDVTFDKNADWDAPVQPCSGYSDL